MKKSTLILAALVMASASTVFAGGAGMGRTPDGGTTVLLLGSAFGGMAVLRRFFRK